MAHTIELTGTASIRRSAVRAVVAVALLAAAGATPVASLLPAAAGALRTQSGVVDPGLRAASGDVEVVVSGLPGGGSAVAEAVRSAGGRVTGSLPIVDGVAATVPAAAL